MKTVFIAIFQAVGVKNILRTNVVKALLERPDVTIVCLARFPERAEYYRKEVPHERLMYDAFYQTPNGLWERFFSFLKFHLIKTQTTDLLKRMHYKDTGSYFSYLAGMAANFVLARSIVRKLLRFFDYRLVGDPGFCAVLEKYQPGVVFLANPFDDVEVALLREAKKRKIPTVGFINSWDLLTSRSTLRLLPDTLVVYNDIVKKEAMELADMPEARIAVCGIPQYDQHITRTPLSRHAFFKKIGLDPDRHLVLFAPIGRKFSNSDWKMIDLLHSIFSEKKIFSNAQLFVRFQPNDFLDQEELNRRPWLTYELPGIRYGTERSGDWDMTFGELAHLTDTLAHTSVLVCYTSSLSVDAAVFDKPVININFEPGTIGKLSQSPIQYYHMTHYRNALNSGGIRIVSNVEELRFWMRRYLECPEEDREGRARLVREQCGVLDGRAGERIAETVLNALRRPISN